MAVNKDLFHVNIPNPLDNESKSVLYRNISGITSMLLAFKVKPTQIRYQASSQAARRVAVQVGDAIQSDGIFDFRRREG